MRQDFKKKNLDNNKQRIVVNRNVMINTTIENLNKKIEYMKTTISKRVGEIEKRKEYNRKDLNTITQMEFRIRDLQEEK